MKRGLYLFFLLFLSLAVHAQILDPIHWDVRLKPIDNTNYQIVFLATIDDGWHLYNMDLPEGGPVSTSFEIEVKQGLTLDGKTLATSKPVVKKDVQFDMVLSWFVREAIFLQKINISNPKTFHLKGHVQYMACNDESCLPPTPFDFEFTPSDLTKNTGSATKTTEKAKTDTTAETLPVAAWSTDTLQTSSELTANPLWKPVIAELKRLNNDASSHQHGTSWWFLLLSGFLGGLLALLTPCVWPIIPMTVSFFLKRNKDRRKAVREAILYGLSIIVIYLILGIGITLLFGSSALNSLSTNAFFNLLFFALLVVFAISFFGAFEMVLPSSWTNKMDQKADSTSGLLSIFFMAFTLALVSFSCTGPIIGTLLVEAATTGSVLGPALGMFGFATALAIPFALFALFPNLLQRMPKSGGWLQTVKVVLGFLELAFALKFLSVADLAYGWGILSRQTFLILWIANFGIMGLWLIFKVRKFSTIRLLLGLVSLTFSGWMATGLWGAPLASISAFAPPATAKDSKLYQTQVHAAFTDYEAGMAYAKSTNKPVMIDFSGFGCVNCRKMENSVWQDERVKNILKNDYVLITLMVDDKTSLDKPLEIVVNGKKRTLRTIGDKWSYLQQYKFGANAQPFYVLLDRDANLLGPSRAYDEDTKSYIEFLNAGLSVYKSR
ncbi:MAG TPA: cytochrome c biogenesis protein CcdA [Bacteroidales bacterium]|nr:cytochrome c biogenesis protein CcdA [Bacteroidales bacterium]